MTQAISPLRQRMIDDMRMRKFSPKTQNAYVRAGLRLAAFLGRSPDTPSDEDLRRYQLHLVVVVRNNSRGGHFGIRRLQTQTDSGMMSACCSWCQQSSEFGRFEAGHLVLAPIRRDPR